MFFDSHAHLDDKRYEPDRYEMLMCAKGRGVSGIINVGFDLPSSMRSIELAEQYDFIFASVGIHPHDAADASADTMEQIRLLAAHPRVVAIGEMGLDYYRNLSPRDIQQKVFRQQIHLAKEIEKPIIVHDRDAHGDLMRILKEEDAGSNGGVLHCFSGSVEMARECIKMGFYISIAGPVTFKNASKICEVAAGVPIECLLIETDAPYLAPEPNRGKRNEPAYVVHIAERIAELRGMHLVELAEATFQNALNLFNIKKI
ncbi:TatD family hydrolase [Phosphitispora sp. TUW77]|uniref:TatD family hydrolase n=1 Tax=Phosphitispora sp. TUW77 TaxID=3152361 RepID=UPI003AB4EBFC